MISVTVCVNGGNNSAELRLDDSAMLSFVRANSTLYSLAYQAWALLKRDPVPQGYLRVWNGSGLQLSVLEQVRHGDWLYLGCAEENFFWPPVRVNHTAVLWHVRGPTGEPLTISTLALEPRLFFIPSFVSDAEIADVQGEVLTGLERSMVLDKVGAESKSAVSSARTSEQAWLSWFSWIGWTLDNRVAALTGIAPTSGERIQVLRYAIGQFYNAHHDYFSPWAHDDRQDLAEGRNRVATVLFYLSDVEAGGETFFPRALTGDSMQRTYGHGQAPRHDDCTLGLAVKPQRGAAVLFYSLEPEGQRDGLLDVMSLHGSCAMVNGTKWAANRWLLNHYDLSL